MDKMRILTVIPSLQIGGAELFCVRLSVALARKHQVTAFIEHMGNTNSALLEQLQNAGIEVRWTPFTQGPLRRLAYGISKLGKLVNKDLNFLWMLEIAALKSLHRQRRFHVINPHLTGPEISAARAFLHDPVRIVATDHGDYRLDFFHRLATQSRYRKLFERTDAIAFPSRNNTTTVQGIPRKLGFDFKVIYYGCEQKPPSSVERPAGAGLVFGMAARGIPEKGWAEALAAFIQAADYLPVDSHLVLVGGGAAVDALMTTVPEKFRDRIHFSGTQADPSPWIAGFDCGLLPSYYPAESLPNFIIECLALGKPVISTPIGGVPEMLETDHGVAGHLVAFDSSGKASIKELASAMILFGLDPGVRTAWIQRALVAARRFDMPLCVDAYEELFSRHTTFTRSL